MYLIKTPKLIRNLFPNYLWQMPTDEKVLYLTFDDGPVPEVTPWVLQTLEKYNAQATFFCVGDNAQKHFDILQRIKLQGHAVGNHTATHRNGWETDLLPYLMDVRRCAQVVETPLFRPPYGRITAKQSEVLQRYYKIVMWDVLSGDFDTEITKETCLENVLLYAQSGSIIVFHDSLKAAERMKYALPRVLEYYTERGFIFKNLSEAMPEKNYYRKTERVLTANTDR